MPRTQVAVDVAAGAVVVVFAIAVAVPMAEPLQLPKGTRVEVTAHWDNSANNPSNPDPGKPVQRGIQSWDEMLSVPMGVITELY